MTNKLFLLCLLAATAAATVLRFAALDKFPLPLNHDEVTQLYDAISIAQTGKDIYGNFLPVVFESVHDFKPPFYTYVTALTFYFLGDHGITIRIPAAVFGVLTVPAIFFLARKLFKNNGIAALAAGMAAIAPYEIFFSRKSFENGAGIFFMLLGFAFLLTSFESKARKIWLYLGGITLLAGMYTYFSQAVIIPLLTAAFVLIFRQEFLSLMPKTGWPALFRYYLFPVLTAAVLVVPLFIIITSNSGSRYRSQTVFITQDSNLGKQLDYAKDGNTLSKFAYFKTVTDYTFSRYLSQFDPDYLFGNGLDLTNQGPLGAGPLFSLQLVFIGLGVWRLLVEKGMAKEKKFIAAWILIGMIPSGVTFEPHSPHRSMMVFTILNIVTAVGLYWLVVTFKKPAVYLGVAALFVFQLVYFLSVYFVNFPFEKSQDMQYPFADVARYAWLKHPDFDSIVFDPRFGQAAPFVGTGAHYYLAYFGHYPPAKFQREYKIGSKEREVLFDKFSVRKIEWNEDIKLKKTLLVLSPWEVDPKILAANRDKIIKTFYFYDHQPAFYALKLE